MAKQTLPTNFVDDILAPSMGGKRKFTIKDNGDGTYEIEDVTDYTQTGSDFGAGQINATNQAVNESCDKADVIDSMEDIVANQASGMIAGAKAVAELNGKLQNIDYEIIESTRYYVKKYENGWFEAWAKTAVIGTDLSFTQIGTSGIYYARVTNIGIGITATEVYDIEYTPQNNGIVWGASPSMSSDMQAVNGYVVQYGADNSRNTNIRTHVTGKWK